jgi:ABC-type transporter Mla MlaB component
MGEATITIDGDLAGSAVQALKERCVTVLQDTAAIMLDFSHCAAIDNGGILLLVQLREYARSRQIACTLAGLNPDLLNALTTVGLSDTFALRGPA